MPECFFKFYMDMFDVTREEAMLRISETPLHKKDRLKELMGSDVSTDSE